MDSDSDDEDIGRHVSRSCSAKVTVSNSNSSVPLVEVDHAEDKATEIFMRVANNLNTGDVDSIDAAEVTVAKLLPKLTVEEKSDVEMKIAEDVIKFETTIDELFLTSGVRDYSDGEDSEVDADGDGESAASPAAAGEPFVYCSPCQEDIMKSMNAGKATRSFQPIIPSEYWYQTAAVSIPPTKTAKQSDSERGKSDKALKAYVYETRLMDMQEFSCGAQSAKGNTLCEYNSNCIGQTTLSEICSLRRDFWGGAFEPAPNPARRKRQIERFIADAHDRMAVKNGKANSFIFRVGTRPVCERSILIMLGLVTNYGRQPRQWREAMQSFVDGSYYTRDGAESKPDSIDKELKKERSEKSKKSLHAATYIQWLAYIFADTCPTNSDLKILPYEDVKQMYDEYKAFCKDQGVHISDQCSYETFRKTFSEMGDVRLRRAKGSFPTCDICNNANDLLRQGSVGFSKARREMILKYKRCHLLQQAKERQHQEFTRMRAKNDEYGGQPLSAYILIDGMTVMSGNTPKVGGGHYHHSKQDTSHITNRVIGAEVVCGPIDTVFFYHTDDIIGGDSNGMIEIVRQVIKDLDEQLKKKSLQLPKEINFQFDNCGENKNQYMFAFLSLLVESFLFEKIHINFLIVGHTHTTIDQYFGVISDAVKRAYFIGSPIALWYLIENVHPDREKRPTVQKQIFVVHDYKSYLTPYINNRIKYYQVPHCFVIYSVFGKAVMQYKLFSTHRTWLPIRPANVTTASLEDSVINDIDLHPMCTVNDHQTFLNSLGIDGIDRSTSELIGNQDALEVVNSLHQMTPEIQRIEASSLHQLVQRCEDEEANGMANSLQRYESSPRDIDEIEKYLRSKSVSSREGFMMWLKHSDSRGNPLPYILDTAPLPLISKANCEAIIRWTGAEKHPSLERGRVDDIDSDQEHEQTAKQSARGLKLTGEQERIKKKFAPLIKAASKVYEHIKTNRFTVKTRNERLNKLNFYHTREFQLVSNENAEANGITPDELQAVLTEAPEYTAWVLTLSEMIFYYRIATYSGAISRYLSELESLPPFQLLDLPERSQAEHEILLARKEHTRYEVEQSKELAERLLVKNRQDLAEGNPVIEAVFGGQNTRCSVKLCNNLGMSMCNTPGANCTGRYFCNQHGPVHKKHEGFPLKKGINSNVDMPMDGNLCCSVIQCDTAGPYSTCPDCGSDQICYQRFFCSQHGSVHQRHYAQILRAENVVSAPPVKCQFKGCKRVCETECHECEELSFCGPHLDHTLHRPELLKQKSRSASSSAQWPPSVTANTQVAPPNTASSIPVNEAVLSPASPNVAAQHQSTVAESAPAVIAAASDPSEEISTETAPAITATTTQSVRRRSTSASNGLRLSKTQSRQPNTSASMPESTNVVAYSDAETSVIGRFERAIMESEQLKPPEKRNYGERIIAELDHRCYAVGIPGLAKRYGIDMTDMKQSLANNHDRNQYLLKFMARYKETHRLPPEEEGSDMRKRKRNSALS